MKRQLKVKIQIYDLLFYLLLVFSFYFTRNIVCSLLMMLFFGYTILLQIKNRSRGVMPFFCIGMLIFILYGAGNIVMKNVLYPSVARTMVISLTLNLMMTYAIIQYINIKRDIPKVLHITECGILTTTVLVVLLSLETITSDRLARGTAMNANMLSLLCVYGFVLALYLRKIGILSRSAGWIRSVIYVGSILLTGSRKALIMIVLVIMVINAAEGGLKIIKAIFTSIIAVVGLYLLIMNVPALYNIIGVRMENLLVLLTEGTTTEGSLNTRQALIQVGMKYIAQNPWTGYGLDCFKMISGMGGKGKVGIGEVGFYAHNNYIELLFGAGIIGMILYYIPVLSTLKKLLKGIKENVCAIYLLALLVSKLAVEYTHVSYYARMDAYIMAIIVGCCCLFNSQRNQCRLG